MPVDPANRVLGQRVKVWVSLIVLVVAVGYLAWDYPRGPEAAEPSDETPDDGEAVGVESEVR